MQAIFTGFDSAWGRTNSGAICDLVLGNDGLRLTELATSTWAFAVNRARRAHTAEILSVWSIDQPICVVNDRGCRPVEADLARALMSGFGCGAHSSNRGNPCWAPNAGIWELLAVLTESAYAHKPMAIPGAQSGRYYFEAYPHPALLGLFDLDHILKYKRRHRDAVAWRCILALLQSLAEHEFPVVNINDYVANDLPQTQDNENKLDAILCAYVAAYWWKYGTERSTLIGDLATGYIVTPHNDGMAVAFDEVFAERQNLPGVACCAPVTTAHLPVPQRLPPPVPLEDDLPLEPQGEWNGEVVLRAIDTANLWRTSRRTTVNDWIDPNRLEGWHLWVRFVQEDGEPAVLFVPFNNHGQRQGGMRPAQRQLNRSLWHFLTTGASRETPIDFNIRYKYCQAVPSLD